MSEILPRASYMLDRPSVTKTTFPVFVTEILNNLKMYEVK
jgi:hypothetical protein